MMQPDKIKHFIENTPDDFDEALAYVKFYTSENFKSLHRDGNPIIQNLDELTKDGLAFLIGNYAAFSQDAIHMLVDAMMRNHDWPLLFKELQENINEEKGSETKGVPHLEIMREGYRKDLGLEVDFQHFDVAPVTKQFLKSMRLIFNNDDNAFSAGALIAFEGTAIEEFYIIDLIIKKYAAIIKKDPALESELPKSLTKYYIDGHKLFEIGHEQHLIDAIKPYIDKGNIKRLLRGYLTLALTMNVWWEQVYLSAIMKENQQCLLDFNQQQTSVEGIIFKK